MAQRGSWAIKGNNTPWIPPTTQLPAFSKLSPLIFGSNLLCSESIISKRISRAVTFWGSCFTSSTSERTSSNSQISTKIHLILLEMQLPTSWWTLKSFNQRFALWKSNITAGLLIKSWSKNGVSLSGSFTRSRWSLKKCTHPLTLHRCQDRQIRRQPACLEDRLVQTHVRSSFAWVFKAASRQNKSRPKGNWSWDPR